jgi:aminoacrylate hydrolase
LIAPPGRLQTRAADGATIAYLCEGAGPAVLLVQGAGIVGEGWRPQIDGLRDRFTLVTPDNRGIGGSMLAPRVAGERAAPLTIEQMAADAIAVMDAAGFDRFHPAGHSMGGLIAQHIALTTPQRVISLAFLCTFLRGHQASRLTLAMLLTALRMRIGTRAMRRNAFLELVMPTDYLQAAGRARLAADLRPLFGRDLAEQPAIVLQQLRAMSRYDASAQLGRLAPIPTLVVSAVHDRIAPPEYGRGLAAAIRGSTYVEMPDAGHGVTIQCADAVNEMRAAHFRAAASPERASI